MGRKRKREFYEFGWGREIFIPSAKAVSRILPLPESAAAWRGAIFQPIRKLLPSHVFLALC